MQFRPYVYFENVLLVNLALNGLILWLTGKLSSSRVHPGRILLGAAIGALFSFALLFPQTDWVTNFLIKFILSILMVLAVFAPMSWRRFFSCLLYFYVISFALGGAVIALIFSSQNLWNGYNLAQSLPKLALCLTLVFFGAVVISHWGHKLHQSRIVQQWFQVELLIHVENQLAQVAGLIDTGNQLRDPVSGWPVLVVEKEKLTQVLPVEILQAAGSGTTEFNFLGQCGGHWVHRIRLIPYTSLGKENGLMIGFRPDKVVFKQGESTQELEQVIIGIAQQNLSPYGTYHALLHPDLLFTQAGC